MFRNETVFILGAGASWHYGYPTGEGLVEELLKMAARLRSHCQHRLSLGFTFQEMPEYVAQYYEQGKGSVGADTAWNVVHAECDALINRLRLVRPTMIDYFLSWNASLQPIATLLIAAVILDCEASSRFGGKNKNRDPKEEKSRPDDWYRFLTHKLLTECIQASDLKENKVRFITFNYDTSLEDHLFHSLSSMDILDPATVNAFLSKDRVIHVYGSIRRDIGEPGAYPGTNPANSLTEKFSGANWNTRLPPSKSFLDQCYAASKELLTIDPDNKEQNKAQLTKAKKWIGDARVVYILGYGFDPNNNKRLGLWDRLRVKAGNPKSVMFTNFEDRNNVNKHASRLFFNTYDGFLDRWVHGAPAKGNFREKSVRNVYDALEKDFESLESLLLPDTKI